MRKEEVVEHIRSAFGGSRCPPPGRIVYDSSGSHAEAQQVARHFGGRDWGDVDSKSILAYDDAADASAALSFMSPEGFRYYLPAFLLFILEQEEKAGLIAASTISKLAPWSDPDDEQMTRFCNERLVQFSDMERQAIVQFLQYTREHDTGSLSGEELDRALQYWKSFRQG